MWPIKPSWKARLCWQRRKRSCVSSVASANNLIRYHSFYAWHREGEYGPLLDEHDRRMLSWVEKFNPYDLYSKTPERPDWETLRPYYTAVSDKYLPGKLRW